MGQSKIRIPKQKYVVQKTDSLELAVKKNPLTARGLPITARAPLLIARATLLIAHVKIAATSHIQYRQVAKRAREWRQRIKSKTRCWSANIIRY